MTGRPYVPGGNGRWHEWSFVAEMCSVHSSFTRTARKQVANIPREWLDSVDNIPREWLDMVDNIPISGNGMDDL